MHYVWQEKLPVARWKVRGHGVGSASLIFKLLIPAMIHVADSSPWSMMFTHLDRIVVSFENKSIVVSFEK